MPTTTSKRREFLQLAKVYDPTAKRPTDVSGWYVSEKLDGTRCFWDGGLTRGLPTASVPWASVIHPKKGTRKDKIKPVSTGLWSRYGNPIIAPDWWLNQLPCCFLDGELWAGRGNFQLNRSIVAGDTPDPRFDQVVFAVYSSPPLEQVFGSGEIKNTNFVSTFDLQAIQQWLWQNAQPVGTDFQTLDPGSTFEQELQFLNAALDNGSESIAYLHNQIRLPDNITDAMLLIDKQLDATLERGGEGVIIRNPKALWTPKRVGDVLKYKPFSDDEGIVTGFTSGRETDKGSKLLGMIGSLILNYKGQRLELAGLTNEERMFATPAMSEYAAEHPDQNMPADFAGKHFKVGQTVTFKYRELSDDGVPKEARFWRQADRT